MTSYVTGDERGSYAPGDDQNSSAARQRIANSWDWPVALFLGSSANAENFSVLRGGAAGPLPYKVGETDSDRATAYAKMIVFR